MWAGGNFPTRVHAHLRSNADKWVPYDGVVILGGYNDVHRVAEYPSCVRTMSSGSSSSASRSITMGSDSHPIDMLETKLVVVC